jgi:hypothetical protein
VGETRDGDRAADAGDGAAGDGTAGDGAAVAGAAVDGDGAAVDGDAIVATDGRRLPSAKAAALSDGRRVGRMYRRLNSCSSALLL